MPKEHLRRLWEEKVPFNYTKIEGEEKKSVENYCKNSGYKYFIHFVTENNYEFKDMNTSINLGNAVSLEFYYINLYKGYTYTMDKRTRKF